MGRVPCAGVWVCSWETPRRLCGDCGQRPPTPRPASDRGSRDEQAIAPNPIQSVEIPTRRSSWLGRTLGSLPVVGAYPGVSACTTAGRARAKRGAPPLHSKPIMMAVGPPPSRHPPAPAPDTPSGLRTHRRESRGSLARLAALRVQRPGLVPGRAPGRPGVLDGATAPGRRRQPRRPRLGNGRQTNAGTRPPHIGRKQGKRHGGRAMEGRARQAAPSGRRTTNPARRCGVRCQTQWESPYPCIWGGRRAAPALGEKHTARRRYEVRQRWSRHFIPWGPPAPATLAFQAAKTSLRANPRICT